jgi:hypothetical protein
VFHVFLYRRFTPVYTATECGEEQATLDKLEVLGGTAHVELKIQVKCINPNPYSIKIVGSTPGRVFVGTNRTLQVGKLEVMPGSMMSEEGNGTVRVRMSADVSLVDAHSLGPMFLTESAIPVLMELRFDVGVYIWFGLRSWGASIPFSKACGLNVAGILTGSSSSSGLGPLVCRPTFEGLHLPPVDFKYDGEKLTNDANMGFTAAQVAPEEVAAGEVAKNVSLLTVIVISFGCGSILVYCAVFDGFQRFCLWYAARRQESIEMCQRASAAISSLFPTSLYKAAHKEPEELVALVESGLHNTMACDAPPRTSSASVTRSGDAVAGAIGSADAPLLDRGELLSRTPEKRTLRLASGSPSESRNDNREDQPEEQPEEHQQRSTSSSVEALRSNVASPESSRARSVKVRGAIGPCAPAVNGLYAPTEELIGGRVAFKRQEAEEEMDDEMWLCFDADVGRNWKVQRSCDRGTATGYMHSDGPTADAEQPGLATRWKVWDGEIFELQESVTLVVLPIDQSNSQAL